MTNSEPNREAAPTADQWKQEMERVVGALRPGRNVQDFDTWQTEVRRQYGHLPYSRLRRAVSLLLTQSDEIPTPMLFGMFVREAETQQSQEARLNAGLLPLDETRREAEQRESYEQIRKRVGPRTEPFEWALCRGVALQRKRNVAADRYRQEFSLPPTAAVPDDVMRVVVQDEDIEAVYQERRKGGVPVGLAGGLLPEASERMDNGFSAIQNLANRRGWGKDVAKFHRERGFKSAREILADRRVDGTLTPRMEEYLQDKIREEEEEAGA